MSGNNFFGGGIGGTVTPRSRGGSIRWHGTLGADATNSSYSPDLSSAVATVGGLILGTYVVTRFYPKAKKAFDREMDKKPKKIIGKVTKPLKATVEGATEVAKAPIKGVKL
tara:strand:+ start:514 stop:846 length:333 start_codon:yes stop_codon:yes gene_type:complete